jgi:hypothetical protein
VLRAWDATYYDTVEEQLLMYNPHAVWIRNG